MNAIDEYLTSLPQDQRNARECLRRIIRSAAPEAIRNWPRGLGVPSRRSPRTWVR